MGNLRWARDVDLSREEFTGPLITAPNLRVLWEMKKDENRLHGRNGRRPIGVRKP